MSHWNCDQVKLFMQKSNMGVEGMLTGNLPQNGLGEIPRCRSVEGLVDLWCVSGVILATLMVF